MWSQVFCLDKLLNYGADVNASIECKDKNTKTLSTELCSYDDNSPLHLAVRVQNPEIIKFLLKHKAEVNVKNVCGSTPLIYALFG